MASFKSLQIRAGTSLARQAIYHVLVPLVSYHSGIVYSRTNVFCTCVKSMFSQEASAACTFGRLLSTTHSYLLCIYLRGTSNSLARLKTIWKIAFGVFICLTALLQTLKLWPQANKNKRVKPYSEANVIITHFPYATYLCGSPNHSLVLKYK